MQKAIASSIHRGAQIGSHIAKYRLEKVHGKSELTEKMGI